MDRKGLCRYDHVVAAVDALRTYMDTCASESNTVKIIDDAHAAIMELKAIEASNFQTAASRKQPITITSAIEEFLKKANRLDPVIEQTSDFIDKNREAFGNIEKIATAISVIKETNNKLAMIKREIDRRITGSSGKNA